MAVSMTPLAGAITAGFATPQASFASMISSFVKLSGATISLIAPAGFGYTPPFTVYKSGATYSADFSMDAVKPTATNTLYVGAGGSNAANGLTWATRLRSLGQALLKADGFGGASTTRILCEARTYRYSDQDGSANPDSFAGQNCQQHTIIEPCDSAGNVLIGGSAASRRIISLHDQVMPAFALVSGSVYASTYTTELPSPGCFDLSNTNAKGNPQALRYAPPASTYANEAAIVTGVAAQAALYGQGACWIDTTNKKFYVQTYNGRAPDSSIVVTRGGINTNGTTSRNLYLLGRFGGIQKFWARDLHLWGGAALYAATYSPDGRDLNLWMADSATCYSTLNGVSTDGGGVYTFLRHTSDDNYKDGYNYDQSAGLDVSGASVMRFHEINCTGDWNGNDTQSDSSCNGSSSHMRTLGVRVASTYNRTLNRAVHDIQAARTWNLGLTASNCRQTGVQSGAFVAGFPANTGETTKLWLDGCVSTGNGYALEAYKGGILYYANMVTTGYVTDTVTGGTISTYNSPPVLPGATGTLSAAALTSSTVQLTFTAASGATSYEYRVNGGTATALAGDKIVTGLTQLTAYTFEVRGANTDGGGAWSNVANATTPASATPTNILLNGDFSGGTTSWSGFGFNGKSVTGGAATFASTPAFDGIQQTLTLTVGKYYDITFTLVRTAGDMAPRFLGTANNAGTTRTASGTYTSRVQVPAGSTGVFQFINGSVFSGTIDNVTVVGPYDAP